MVDECVVSYGLIWSVWRCSAVPSAGILSAARDTCCEP